MPQRIQILTQSVADKIAAGEVVERPASVVKELVENAIDARCTRVRIQIKGGGEELIRVSDDGCGMSSEDAQLAFSRHATSKITTEDDLEAIQSLGFRGEALPSIAAVSAVELSTREQGEPMGTTLEVVGGEMQEVAEVGRPVGTSVTVKRLFFNTPARKKFLRSGQTEFRRIVDLINNLAMAHWGVSFQLLHNGRETVNLPRVNGLKERLVYLWPKDIVEDLLFFNQSGPQMRIEGCVSTTQTSRSGRQQQLFILNKRPVTDRSLSHALFQAYQPIFPKDRHPAAIVLLSLDPAQVDVNVHPAKREVRFRDGRGVHDLVAFTVSKVLSQTGPITELKEELASLPSELPEGAMAETKRPYQAGDEAQEPVQEKLFGSGKEDSTAQPDDQAEPQSELISLWQLHNLYILAAIKSGLVIIDQHAAHERVLYEKAKRSFRESASATQQLLFPQVVELTKTELQVLDEHQDLLLKIGFSVRPFGGKTVLVEAEPATLKGSAREMNLREILEDLSAHQLPELDREERMARSFACKGAVKAGDPLTQEEMNSLVNMLFSTSAPYTCPHGRPTIIRMNLEELARKFGR